MPKYTEELRIHKRLKNFKKKRTDRRSVSSKVEQDRQIQKARKQKQRQFELDTEDA
jgi:hypothetical protein